MIHEADPKDKVKVHDVRKYAASCTLAKTMDISGMVRALRWKSPHTFFKSYMCPTRSLAKPAILPAGNDPDPTESAHSEVTPNYEGVTSDLSD